jgi:hypothetical protein
LLFERWRFTAGILFHGIAWIKPKYCGKSGLQPVGFHCFSLGDDLAMHGDGAFIASTLIADLTFLAESAIR